MNILMNNIRWMMHDDLPDIFKAYTTSKNQDRKYVLTEEQLCTVVHPKDDWMLVMEFDERSIKDLAMQKFTTSTYTDKEESYVNVTVMRCLKFDKTATVCTVLKAISEGRCYGFLEGFADLSRASHELTIRARSTAEERGIAVQNIYYLMWGT